jgi:IS30 family transposase
MNKGPDQRSITRGPGHFIGTLSIPGHWEGDLLAGSANTHVATLVERHSRFLLLVRVEGKDTQSVITALTRQVKGLPEQLRGSLTWDRGTELAAHTQFTVATDLKVYFPRARGSADRTRTPTVCCANICRKAPTSPSSHSTSSTKSAGS